MRILNILSQSLSLALKSPKAFIPRTLMTVLYSIFHLTLAKITSSMLTQNIDPLTALTVLLFLTAFTPLLFFIDLLSYAMYPSIVEDLRKNEKINLTKAFKKSLKIIPTILGLGVVIIIFTIIEFIGFFLAYYAYTVLQNMPLTVIFGLTTLVIMLVFSALLFFVMPQAVYDNQGIINNFKKSASYAVKDSVNVIGLNIVFLIFVFVSMGLAFFEDYGGETWILAATAYIFVRAIQAILYTYLGIVNPTAYLSLDSLNSSQQ